jgi:hypothetical protein
MFVHLQEGGRVQLTTLFTFGVSRPIFYNDQLRVTEAEMTEKGAKSSPTKSKGKMTKDHPKFREDESSKKRNIKSKRKGERVMAFFFFGFGMVCTKRRNGPRE